MKIALLVPEMEMGGVEECVADLAAGFVGRGHTVFLLSAGGRLVPGLRSAGVECFSLPLHRKDPFSFFYSLQKTKNILNRIRPDIVHAHSRVPAWAGYYAVRLLSHDRQRTGLIPPESKAAASRHGGVQSSTPHKTGETANAAIRMKAPRFITTFHAFYNTHWPSRSMSKGERVIAVSRVLGDYAVRYFGVAETNIRVVYNGVRPVETRGDVKSKDLTPTIGAFGRLTAGKGFDLFLDILEKVRVSYPAARGLLGLGVSPSATTRLERLKKRAETAGLAGAVTFLVNSRPDDFYRRTDIYLACVTEPEGFGRVVIEAQTAGIPVVASRLGAFPELIEDGVSGILAEPDAESFRAALLGLLTDPGLRERIAGEGMRRARERFTVDRMVEETLKIYEELLYASVIPADSKQESKDV